MTDDNDKINQLQSKLDNLKKQQDSFLKEMDELQKEIYALKYSTPEEVFEEEVIIFEESVTSINFKIEEEKIPSMDKVPEEKIVKKTQTHYTPIPSSTPQLKSDIEKFIGENLINKIGIVITVIGVGIGAKYSIEHQLISPLTRIVLGYLMGVVLLGFGIKLKKDYEKYSAVLVSGAIAIMYFITFSAYSFYGLLPKEVAFVLMVVFTAFTVVAAINYNQQVIAHIGLVGAYAVPFLLSDGSGKVAILFTYMAIINAGILVIAFKKYWKPLYYVSFILTWLVFAAWYFTKYDDALHFTLALVFLFIFFLIFYVIFLAYKLLQKEKFDIMDVQLLLSNSFIFYGLGYSILSGNVTGAQLLGAFTLGNAIVHFCVSSILYKQKLADRNLFFLIAGLVLVFITITIPVQLDGNWVTLLWAFEAALLFWIGRTKEVPVYEKLSYPLMLLAFLSITQDWLTLYDNYDRENALTRITPLFNINFLSSLLFIVSFGFINVLNTSKKYVPANFSLKSLHTLVNVAAPAILLIAMYYSFRIEIETYWNQLYLDSMVEDKIGDGYSDTYWNYDLSGFKTLWVINYSLVFFSILSFVNIKKIKNSDLGLVNIGINTFVLFVFLTEGLYTLSELRDTYLTHPHSEYYQRGIFNIEIRYISFVFVGLMIISIYKYTQQNFLKPIGFSLIIAFDILLFSSLLWIASSELIHWMDMLQFSQSYKLGLSILWGVYALFLIAYGIWKKKKHLRIGAIAVFTVTLIKLFVYDISHLDTIAKTIVFVSLGVLLLIISFLYNKYKHLISEENEN
jgi:uncharacterized membrane protein